MNELKFPIPHEMARDCWPHLVHRRNRAGESLSGVLKAMALSSVQSGLYVEFSSITTRHVGKNVLI